jgi:hypothetical protein
MPTSQSTSTYNDVLSLSSNDPIQYPAEDIFDYVQKGGSYANKPI